MTGSALLAYVRLPEQLRLTCQRDGPAAMPHKHTLFAHNWLGPSKLVRINSEVCMASPVDKGLEDIPQSWECWLLMAP